MRLDETARGFMHTDTEFATSSSQASSALERVGCVGIPPGIRERRRVGGPEGPVVAASPRSQANLDALLLGGGCCLEISPSSLILSF